MAVDGPQVDRPAGAAPRTEDIQPRRSGDQRGAYGGGAQHVAASADSNGPALWGVEGHYAQRAVVLIRSL